MKDEKSQIQCVVISGDKRADDFMHRADVFESFKVLAVVEEFKLTLTPDASVNEAMMTVVKTLAECHRRVVAVFVPNSSYGYFDDSVTVISNGKTWCLLKNILKKYNCMVMSKEKE
jgi:hypothetical protein